MSAKKSTTATAKNSKGFTDDERAAMNERAQELKAQARRGPHAQKDKGPTERAPCSAYAKEDGKIVCFFQSAKKFNSRYATLGFSDKANLDEGAMWPTSFALKELGATEEAKISALLNRVLS